MKTLETIKDEVAKEMMFDNFKQAGLDRLSIDEVAKRYASECVDQEVKAFKEKVIEDLEYAVLYESHSERMFGIKKAVDLIKNL
jgi:hypothetical protein